VCVLFLASLVVCIVDFLPGSVVEVVEECGNGNVRLVGATVEILKELSFINFIVSAFGCWEQIYLILFCGSFGCEVQSFPLMCCDHEIARA
jgi:hypothetical protein